MNEKSNTVINKVEWRHEIDWWSDHEIEIRKQQVKLFEECPIPKDELISHLGLFIRSADLSRLLFMHDLYKKILAIQGIVIEFGVRWGQNLALFESFRGLYEPYNTIRKIVGFDTFAGFLTPHQKDGCSQAMFKGTYSVPTGYEDYLAKILDYHEQEHAQANIKKYELVKGDAVEELEKYLQRNPSTIIALAYFDMDLYVPTKGCLELIKDYVTKGTVIGFDEVNSPNFPGETIALKEVFGLDKYSIKRSPNAPYQSFIVID